MPPDVSSNSCRTASSWLNLIYPNAFNSLRRGAMLQAAADKVPEIYKFCYLSYQQSSILQFNRFKFLSNEGPQQGDPLGSLLFCLTINPLLTSTTSDLTMDDVTLGWHADAVAGDVEMFRTKGTEMGLQLNVHKCELISVNSNNRHISEGLCSDGTNQHFSFRCPLLLGNAMDNALEARCDDLARAISRLKLLSAHEALLLLRACFSAPKIVHILRCSPCSNHTRLL